MIKKYKLNAKLAKSLLEVIGGLLLNLSSGWFGVILISPGILGKSFSQTAPTLLANIPFGILSLLFSVLVLYKLKIYGSR